MQRSAATASSAAGARFVNRQGERNRTGRRVIAPRIESAHDSWEKRLSELLVARLEG